MINKSSIGDYFTGLVILSHSVPSQLRDANGDNLRDALLQTLRDAADELDLGREVNWDAEGEPADVVPIQRTALKQLTEAAATINAALDGYSPDEVMP